MDTLQTDQIRKKKRHLFLLFLALPPLILLTLFRIVPVLDAVSGPFDPELLRHPGPVLKSLATGAAFNLTTLLITGLGALAIGITILRYERLFGVIITLLLLPLFFPAALLVTSVLSLAGIPLYTTDGTTPTSVYAGIIITVSVIRNIGIPTMMGVHYGRMTRNPVTGVIRAILLWMMIRAVFLFTADFEIFIGVSRTFSSAPFAVPYTAIWSTAPVNRTCSNTVWVVRAFLQICLAGALFHPARKLMRQYDNATGETVRAQTAAFTPPPAAHETRRNSRTQKHLIASTATILISLPVLLLCAYPLIRVIVEPTAAVVELRSSLSSMHWVTNYLQFLFLSLVSVLFALYTALSFAWLLIRAPRPFRIVFTIFLLILLSASAPGWHDFQILRKFRMLNSLYPFMLANLFPLLPVFILARPGQWRANEKETESVNLFYRFLPGASKTIAGLAAVQFSLIWNTIGCSGLCMTYSAENRSPATLLHAIAAGSYPSSSGALLYGLMLLLPPCAVFVLFRHYITGKEILSAAGNSSGFR